MYDLLMGLAALAILGFLIALVCVVHPIARLRMGTRKRALIGVAASFAILLLFSSVASATESQSHKDVRLAQKASEEAAAAKKKPTPTATAPPCDCGDLFIGGIAAAPAAPAAPADPNPSTAPGGVKSAETAKPSSEVHYATCTDAKAAGATPLRRGQPGYSAALDLDGDGVACE